MAWNPFIGTCRVLDPAHYLRRERKLPALHTAHRVHSLREIERLVSILAGSEIDQSTLHTLSDAAFANLVERPDRLSWTIQFLNNLKALWRSTETVVIEVSTLKQCYVDTDDGRLWVNFYTQRDLERFSGKIEPMIEEGYLAPIRSGDIKAYPFREDEALATMERIKSLSQGRRIIWASHFNVAALSEETARLHETRTKIARIVSEGAASLGDRFYDPTEVVREFGETRALEKHGTDYNHYTLEAMQVVADRYWKMIAAWR